MSLMSLMSWMSRSMSPRTWLSHGILACAALVVVAAAPNPARADILIGVDIEGVEPLDSPAEFGGGFAVRLGDQIHLPLIAITPELAFSYANFSEDYGPSIYRGTVGARLGIGEIIRPGIYAHIGLGRYELDLPGDNPSGTDVTYDVGLVLDFTVLPLLNLGVHAAYNRLGGDDVRDDFEWLTTGAHVELVF
jgi:hypothetical protein